MISATDLRTIKKQISTTLATVINIGEVIPTRKTFKSEAQFFETVNALTTQKALETTECAGCLLYLLRPHDIPDLLNEKLFYLTYAVRLFRKTFQNRVDESDAFETKILLSEDIFDAVCVQVGEKFRNSLTVSGLSADLKATILPIENKDDIQFGTPEYLTVECSFLDFLLKVEIINVC